MRQGTLSLVDQAVVSATAFATSVTVGRLCSKQDLGVFCLALTIVYLARAIQDQIVSAPYMIYCHRRHGEGRRPVCGRRFAAPPRDCLLWPCCSWRPRWGCSRWASARPVLPPCCGSSLAALPLLLLREFIRRVAIAHLHMATAIAIDVSVAAPNWRPAAVSLFPSAHYSCGLSRDGGRLHVGLRGLVPQQATAAQVRPGRRRLPIGDITGTLPAGCWSVT